jgi:predicted Rossmann fold flavoprotein
MERWDLVVIGGGAAGFFGAIAAAEARRGLRVCILEKGSQPLAKVRISGGGRCNVTHACFEPRSLVSNYPRGPRALLPVFSRFQPRDTVEWFRARGVELKTEADGRLFPVTDDSGTVVNCLLESAQRAGIVIRLRCAAESVERLSSGDGWCLEVSGGERMEARHLLMATGGCRSADQVALLQRLGLEVVAPVPSLFTFHVEEKWVRALAGLSVDLVELSVRGESLKECGPVLFTHWGLSGPAVLRLSAWGARRLEELGYAFDLRVQWMKGMREEDALEKLQRNRTECPGKLVANGPSVGGLPARLWEALVTQEGIDPLERWNQITREKLQGLARRVTGTGLRVVGKSLNKEEFVTCGGVDLKEVDFRTLASRRHSGLYFAGEVLDVDGVTGGFNFQAAWSSGWIAGQAIAAECGDF